MGHTLVAIPSGPTSTDRREFVLPGGGVNAMDPGKSFSAAEEEATDSVSTKPEEVAAYQSSEVKQARLQSMLAALLDDPILADVPRKPSLADVDTLINLELGSAMRLTVVKLDGTSFDVAMLNTATVKDLKMAIRKKTEEIEQEKMGHRHISWKHIWDNYCLTHQSEKLIDDNSVLSSNGIHNNSKVYFSPHVMSRVYRKHSRRRKHRFFHGLNRKIKL
uniref:SNRNP25 ubiquitin-like domain-containing protein n=1 Tax=Oryza punctata TaxID=4537 RepID=A0A0E0KWD3_ORYPU